MSPERIRNENYSYPADIWSLGLALFECGTGEFPYTANDGPVNLMLQVTYLYLPTVTIIPLYSSKKKKENINSLDLCCPALDFF